jgi:hypothetical protein
MAAAGQGQRANRQYDLLQHTPIVSGPPANINRNEADGILANHGLRIARRADCCGVQSSRGATEAPQAAYGAAHSAVLDETQVRVLIRCRPTSFGQQRTFECPRCCTFDGLMWIRQLDSEGVWEGTEGAARAVLTRIA